MSQRGWDRRSKEKVTFSLIKHNNKNTPVNLSQYLKKTKIKRPKNKPTPRFKEKTTKK